MTEIKDDFVIAITLRVLYNIGRIAYLYQMLFRERTATTMEKWQKFKTTRLYLHPPRAERLLTLWRDGKVILGEIETPVNKPYEKQTCSGIWFTHGDCERIDFKNAEYILREDGIPAHALSASFGELSAKIECASRFERRPNVYIKITLKNEKSHPVCEKFGFILRTGAEAKLVFGSPDVYAIYNPDISVWKGADSTWSYDGIWRDNDRFAAVTGDVSFKANAALGWAEAEIRLDPCEEKTVYITFGKGEYTPSSYEEVKAEYISGWESELRKITKLPDSILADGEKVRLIKNLTVQLLQCFCYGKDTDELYSRQGGLQRRVWTYEAMPVLVALNRIGDFDDYIEDTIDLYFTKFREKSGEMVPLGIHWAMATGTVLRSFGEYAQVRGKNYYERYRDAALGSFEWMRETRQKANYDGAVAASESNRLDGNYLCVDGLFPPMSACDDPLVFQAWLSTDCNNVMGLDELAKAAEKYGDPRAEEIRREVEEYRGVIQGAWDNLKAMQGDGEELYVPYTPAGDNEEVTKRYHFSPSMGFLMDSLRLPPEDYNRIIKYYSERGLMRGGLYNKMPDKDPSIPGNLLSIVDEAGHSLIWYVCAQEYGWFKNFLEHGELDRCHEIVRDVLRFAISDEYYMLERYHEGNVWYSPWSPNASCNGRLINMLLDLSEN